MTTISKKDISRMRELARKGFWGGGLTTGEEAELAALRRPIGDGSNPRDNFLDIGDANVSPADVVRAVLQGVVTGHADNCNCGSCSHNRVEAKKEVQ